jgi:hypothetical protein
MEILGMSTRKKSRGREKRYSQENRGKSKIEKARSRKQLEKIL